MLTLLVLKGELHTDAALIQIEGPALTLAAKTK